MTDRESKLIERLIQGDMKAFDELCPNAKPEDRVVIEDAIKTMPNADSSSLWFAWVLYLMSKTL